MTYKYQILKIKRQDINISVNNEAAKGWKVLHIQAITEVIGAMMNGAPKTEFYYDIFFEKAE